MGWLILNTYPQRICAFLKNISFTFRQRGREGERKGQKYHCRVVASQAPPYWGPGQQYRHVPWLGIELATLWFTVWPSINWGTPPGQNLCIVRRLRHVFLVNSPTRGRKWPSKSTKAGPSACAGQNWGSNAVWLVPEFREERDENKISVWGLWDTFFALLFSSFVTLDNTWGWRNHDHLNLCPVLFSLCKTDIPSN